MSPRRSRRRVAAALAATLLAGALTAWVTSGPREASAPRTAAPSLPPSSGQVPSPVRTGPLETPTPHVPAPTGSQSAAAVPTPTALEISSIRLRMPLAPVGLDPRGDMELPESPNVAGWYRYGPAPGADAGASVLAAHVDTPTAGVGPLAALEKVQPGSEVVVRSGRQVRRYRVVSVKRLDKGTLDLGWLFARDGPHRLHIVTCGGEFDRRTRQYADNVVAVAVPVSGR